MQPVEVYFSFHPPHGKDFFARFGHVNAFGYTVDETWFFFQPQRDRLHMLITHRHDEVEDLMGYEWIVSRRIIKVRKALDHRHPPLLPYTCASMCGALVGIRAFTIGSLERKLLRNGGIVVHDAEREPRGPESAGTGAQASLHGAPEGH